MFLGVVGNDVNDSFEKWPNEKCSVALSTVELEDFMIVEFARIGLDGDFVVFSLPAGAHVVILLKRFSRYWQLNDHPLLNSSRIVAHKIVGAISS